MCEHLKVEGDNYEETCIDSCLHQWQPDGEDYETCTFCGEERIVGQA